MEEYRRERLPADSIESYVGCVDEVTYLQFTANGFRLFEYREAGGSRLYSVEIGNWSTSFTEADVEPVLLGEANDLAGLFPPDAEDAEPDNDDFKYRIDTKEYLDWKSRMMPPSDVIRAAKQELARRETEGDEVIVACKGCDGEKQLELECSCVEETISKLEQTFGREELMAGINDINLIDPDCEHCQGNGTRLYDCSTCEGGGKMSKYPLLILANEITGEQRKIKLDLAALINSGDAEVGWFGGEYSDNTGFQSSNQFLRFTISPYIYRNMEEIGLDPANSARMFRDRVVMPDPQESDVFGQQVSWLKSNGFVRVVESLGSAKYLKPADVLEEAQLTLAKVHAQSETGLKNEDGIVVEQYWLMRPLRSAEETIQDLVTALDTYNLNLGLTINPVDQIHAGPTFYIMDRSGIPLFSLGGSVDSRASLENAWLNLRDILSNAFDSD